jgi:hypothetical protein
VAKFQTLKVIGLLYTTMSVNVLVLDAQFVALKPESQLFHEKKLYIYGKKRRSVDFMHHPIQPLESDSHGVLRFKRNAIVEQMLEWGREHGHDLNKIAMMDFSNEDRQQFAQLIGYSLDGYSELSYVDDYAYGVACTTSPNGASETEARIAYLEGELKYLKESLAEPMARLFERDPYDFR